MSKYDTFLRLLLFFRNIFLYVSFRNILLLNAKSYLRSISNIRYAFTMFSYRLLSYSRAECLLRLSMILHQRYVYINLSDTKPSHHHSHTIHAIFARFYSLTVVLSRGLYFRWYSTKAQITWQNKHFVEVYSNRVIEPRREIWI